MRGIGNVRAYPRSCHGMMSTLPAEEASTRAFRRRRGALRTDSTREERRISAQRRASLTSLRALLILRKRHTSEN